MEGPSVSQSRLLQLEEECFNRWQHLGGVHSSALQAEGDLVTLKIHHGEGEAGFGQPAPLIDCDSPTDLPPIGDGGEGSLNYRAFLVANLRLLLNLFGLDSHTSGWIPDDILARDGLIQDLPQDPQIEEGGVQLHLGASVPLPFILVIGVLPPAQIVEAIPPADLGSGSDLFQGEVFKKVSPSPAVTLERQILVLMGDIQPWLNPRGKIAIRAFGGRGSSLSELLGGPQASSFTGLMDRINPLSGGFLPQSASIINELDPPERAARPLVKGCHSVASVAFGQKKANSYRENLKGSKSSTQRGHNSWFKSMRGSHCIYQALAGSVAKSVATFHGRRGL